MKLKLLCIVMSLLILTACSAMPWEESAATVSAIPSKSETEIGSQEDTTLPEEIESAESVDPTETELPTDSEVDTDPTTGGIVESTESTQVSTSGAYSPSESTEPIEQEIYEHSLAALTIYALTFEYFSFELEGVYAASIVPMSQKMQSKGVYLAFESYGEKIIVHTYPIESENKTPGACNVYSPEVGYAAFDVVSSLPDGLSAIDKDSYTDALGKISMPTVTSY